MLKDLNPSCEYKHCKSFFQIAYSTMQWTKSTLPIQQSGQSISDEVKFVNRKGEVKYKTLTNIDNLLFYKTSKDKYKWIDFENAIIELFYHSKYGHGIRLIKCFDVIEIFCDSQSWFKYLKRYTIQCDFNSNYILRKKIGKGQFSDVFRGKNKNDGNEYAVKIYQKQTLFDDVDKAAVAKQISVLRRLQSEFTVKFFEVFENSDQIFVVLELLMGGNLMDYIIRENFFSEDQAAKVIFRLVKAVNYIHSKNMIHRDLKPENIVFRLQDNIETLCIKKFQLADFYNPDNTNYHYVCCGTPGFIAPEILLEQNYDQKVDVFSIGVILYILMTGQMPFDGNFEKRLEQNVEGLVDFSFINLSHLGMDFIKTTLQPNPEERLSSHQCLNHKWFIQEQLAKIQQIQLKKPLQLQNQLITRRMKQAKTLTFSPSSPSSQNSLQSPRNFVPKLQTKQPPVIAGCQTERIIGQGSSSKSYFEQFQQPTDDDDQNQDNSNMKKSFQGTFHGQFRSARKKTQSFVIRSNQTMKNFNLQKKVEIQK